jgi:hypothetical protein
LPGGPAVTVLKDPNRIFLSSPYVHLEVCPKALFHKQRAEYAFYQRYFERAVMARSLKALLTLAVDEAARSGVGPMDALHLAAAHLLNADEFITTERPRKSIYRTSLVNVIYLFQ